jgi:Amt family ammonium transporter
MTPVYDSGDTAWIILCTALVLLMTPSIATFYAGMVRSKHALGMMMYGLAAIVSVSITWVLLGFSLAFGPQALGGFVGNLHHAGLAGLSESSTFSALNVPPIAFATFTMMIAVVSAAIITGAAADRMKFGAMLSFLALWSVGVFPVIAHWVLADDGWLAQWGVLDFAGGSVVGVSAGASALALVLVLGPRRKWQESSMRPHSLPLTLVGAALLWIGWLGLTAGSALSADGVAASAVLATHLAAVGAVAGWVLLEKRLTGSTSARGAVSGAIAGLVAVTPAAGFLDPFASLLLGFIAGGAAYLAMRIKFRFHFDDALDVVAVHLVSGTIGLLFVGLFAREIVSGGTVGVGLLSTGDASLLGKQAVAVLVVAAYSFVASAIIAMVLRAVMGLRVTPEGEEQGLDIAQHGEAAYEIRH